MLDVVRKWWSQKYSLPPNDARFLDVPFAEHLGAWIRELWDRKVSLEEALEEPIMAIRVREDLLDELSNIDRALGLRKPDVPSTTGDPLGDYWLEKQLAGTITEEDLELTVEDVLRMRAADG